MVHDAYLNHRYQGFGISRTENSRIKSKNKTKTNTKRLEQKLLVCTVFAVASQQDQIKRGKEKKVPLFKNKAAYGIDDEKQTPSSTTTKPNPSDLLPFHQVCSMVHGTISSFAVDSMVKPGK